MPLRGELNSVDLAHIFQMLILNQKAGTLELVSEGVKRPLFFTPQGVLVPFDRGHLVDRAIAALQRSGAVSAVQVEKATFNSKALKKDVLETLVHMNVLTPEGAVTALRQQLEEDVYELFFLKDASFEFREDDAPENAGELDPDLALSPNGLIMEAARRIDEWQYIERVVESGSQIVESIAELSVLEPKEIDAELRAVYAAIDGIRTVDRVTAICGVPRFVVFRKVAILLEREVARSVPAEELVARGERMLAQGDAESAVHLFERAIMLGAREVGVLTGAGRARESLGETGKAADHYLNAGRRAEEDGDLDAALKLYGRIRRILPTQIEARERLFALRKVPALKNSGFDPMAEGMDLARILFELRRREELALVLAGLRDLAQDADDALESVADLAARLGVVAVAIDALQSCADARARSRDYTGSIRALKKAQALDPSKAGIGERIRIVENSVRARRARRKSTRRSLVMMAAFGVLFILYGRFSKAAMEEYTRYSIEDFVSTKDFEGGREFYGSLCRSFPLTIPFLLSLENLRELEFAQDCAQEIEQYRQGLEAQTAEERLRQARFAADAALNARHTGDYGQALELLKKALQLSGDSDPLNVSRSIADIEEYLDGAARVRAQMAFYRNAGRFDEAHRRVVDLIEKYPNAPGVKDLTIPVLVTSDPPRARISINGAPVRNGEGSFAEDAETPFVLDLPQAGSVAVELRLEGFMPARETFDPSAAATHRFVMPRAPDRELIVPQDVAHDPATNGDAVVLVQQHGRVTCIDGATLAVRWSVTLPGGANGAGPAAFVGNDVLLGGEDGRLYRLGGADGRTVESWTLPGRPCGTPAFCEGFAAVALDAGGVAIGELAPGATFTPADLGKATGVGPIAAGVLGRAQFALGGMDGRVWIAASDATLTAVPVGDAPRVAVTCITVLGGTLLAGDAAGNVHAVDLAGLTTTAAVEVFPGAPIDTLRTCGDGCIVASRGTLATLDSTWRVRARSTETDLSVLAGVGPRVVASRPDGTVHVLDPATLVTTLAYALGASGDLGGVVCGPHAVLHAPGGKVWGVLCLRD